jgi:glucokinase
MTTAILADIGGTNARFGLWTPADGFVERFDQRVADCPDLETAIDRARTRWDHHVAPVMIVIALPGAVDVSHDHIHMVNNPWLVRPATLQSRFQTRLVDVINDFTAQAWALPAFTAADVAPIGTETGWRALPESPLVIVGPGTGLGLGAVIPDGQGGWTPLPSEGGHIGLTPRTTQEWRVVLAVHQLYGDTDTERLLSGPGLGLLYRLLSTLAASAPDAAFDLATFARQPEIKPEQIPARIGTDPIAAVTVRMFLDLLADFTGNAALTLGARGGVYLSGNVMDALTPWLNATAFRTRFDARPSMRAYLKPIPTYRVIDNAPAFKGLATMATQRLERLTSGWLQSG